MAETALESYPFYHGNISRDEADCLLQPPEEGLFLIRKNQHFAGELSLSIAYKDTTAKAKKFAVEHYRIKVIDGKYTVDDEEFFVSLDDLVKHYKEDADGLVTKLIRHVIKTSLVSSEWQLQREKLTTGELIGKGNFSEVYEGSYDGATVAVKILKDKSAAEDYLLEVNVMATLKHPNLVRLQGVICDEAVIIVTEYMAKGSLLDYLRSRGRSAITPQELINFAKDTCAGMTYLESKGVVHRDLAARNILIQDNGTAKVADFGLARTLDEPSEKQQPDGKIAVRWTAPEAVQRKEFSSKSDVWSFGIVLWEIYSFGRVPYPKIMMANVMEQLETGYRMDPPDGCPTRMRDIMKRTWNWSPEQRPTFQEMLDELSEMTP